MIRIFIVFIALASCCWAGDIKYVELQKKLNLADSEINNYNDEAFTAYVELMKLGASGFKVISDTWANGSIPEGIWIDWSYDFATRFAKSEYQDRVKEYDKYMVNRFKKDKAFAKAAINKFLIDQIYNDDMFVSWLSDKRYRLIAYSVLKQKYPKIPSLDWEGDKSEQEAGVIKIKEYIKHHSK